MADDLVLTVKQIAQYPQLTATAPTDRYLLQQSGVGGPYLSIAPTDLIGTALEQGGWLHLAPGSGLAWNGAALSFQAGSFNFTEDVAVPSLHSTGDIFVAGDALATQINVDQLFDSILENSVFTVNGRKGNVILEEGDILRAGAAPIRDAHFGGFNTAPTPWDTRNASDQIATCGFVQNVIAAVVCSGSVVTSFNGRGGDVTLTADDITMAATVVGAVTRANTPPFGDVSNRIATTAFVDDGLSDLQQQIDRMLPSIGGYAPLNSPQFTGIPTAPTATVGSATGQLATTAFVHNAVTAATAGVASFNTRTGAVTLQATDVTGVGGALLASPAFTGNVTAPTAAPGTNTTAVATTAFVAAAVAAVNLGVTSFNTRTGSVTLITADITGAGGAPINAPTFTGVPAGPTAAPATNTTQLATTAFVQAALAALGPGVTSFNARTGAVTLQFADISAAGGAPITSPAFSGTPTAPAPNPGTNTTQIPTCAWVNSAISGATAGVASFNGRTGAVTLIGADISGAGGALLASPSFTGAPQSPTPAQTVNDTTIATTAYVRTALAAAPGGVSSWNTRTGAVTLQAADLSAVGGALLAGPSFTGVPSAPTAGVGTNTTQLATCAFVAAAVANVVSSFNGRNGAVTLSAADITGAGGALLASPALSGTPTAPTATAGTNNTQIATTAFVAAALPAAGGVTYQSWSYTTAGPQTFTTPANSSTATVYRLRGVAGGGGGGGGQASGAYYGSGGGGGEGVEGLLTGLAASTAVTLNIGAGGLGGQGNGGAAQAGGNTTLSVGALSLTLNGGGAGDLARTSAGTGQPGGAGGHGGSYATQTNWTLMLPRPGQSGQQSNSSNTAPCPNGGASMLGDGGTGANNNSTVLIGPTAQAGYGPGPGGGAAPAYTTAATGIGFTGAAGAIIIERVAG